MSVFEAAMLILLGAVTALWLHERHLRTEAEKYEARWMAATDEAHRYWRELRACQDGIVVDRPGRKPS